MIALSLAEIATIVNGQLHGDPSLVVDATVVTDSREARAGSLFVAISGEQVDGHDYAHAAAELGAVATLAQREVSGAYILVPDAVAALGALARHVLETVRAGSALTVIGITGSVGKTTTKDLLAQILAPHGETIWPPNSFNNEIGLPMTVLRLTHQTRYLVLELGASGPGHIRELVEIAPLDTAAVLKVGQAHLGGFGSVAAVASAKAEILAGLVPGGMAVLNADDQLVAAMQPAAGRAVSFGTTATSQVRATGIGQNAAGRLSFTVHYNNETLPVSSGLVGEHQVHNILAALAIALANGIELADAVGAIGAATQLSPHRMAVHELDSGVRVIDDAYNANPDSMRAALRTLATMSAETGRRSVAVLGEMRELGAASLTAHDLIGRLAVRLNISWLIVVGSAARAMSTAAQHEGSWGDEVSFVEDIGQAQSLLDERLQPGDIVLVKASNGTGLWRLADQLLQTGPRK